MPRGANVGDTDWSAYGSCETCGCVPGWPCHRGKRQLKNPHPGRPRTGQEPYAGPRAELYPGGPIVRVPEEADRAPLATEARASGCTCPEPAQCPECLHEFECPMAEDPRPWCECEHGETCKGPCRQRAHDPAQHRDPTGLEFPEGPSTYHAPSAYAGPTRVELSSGYALLAPELAELVGDDYLDRVNARSVPAAELVDAETLAAMAEVTGQSEHEVEAQLAAEVAELGPSTYHPPAGDWQVDNGDTDTGAYGAGVPVFIAPAAQLYQLEKAALGAIGADPTTKEDTVAGASYTLENAERFPANPTGKRRVDAEIPRDIPRDQYDRPKLVRAEYHHGSGHWIPSPTGEIEGYTRASTLGNALESSEGLSIWRGGMIVYGMSRRKDLVLAAQAIPGTDDKRLHRRPLYAIADQAKEAAEASSAATVGTALHALTDQADRGNLTVDIGEYQPVLDIYLERMTGWKVVQSETFVVSDHFHAAGSFDRLITPLEPMALVDKETGEIITVIMPGDLIVVDLKTSTTADYFGAKFFAQLAVYVTGQAYDRDPESPTFGRRTPLGQRTDFALILHIPQGGDADGEPQADWQWLDMRAGLALAQLACVVLETRKKRFTRTHMRPVLAEPYGGMLVGADTTAPVTVPRALPARDPLGSEHLAATSGFIAETESFPDAAADRVDAELAEDGRMPEERRPAPAAVVGTNLGAQLGQMSEDIDQGQWITEALAGRDPEDVIAANEPGDAELINALEAEAMVPAHAEQEHGDPQGWTDGGHVPGPDETAPLPDGWESRDEQELAAESMTSVPRQGPKPLGRSLQEAAERHKVEAALIRKIERATSVRGPDGLVDLHERAAKAGYWTDRVKAAATKRKLELR